MSNSEFFLKNPEGKSVKFNFQLENGLPVKPIINPYYEEGFSKSDGYYAISMFLSEQELIELGDLAIKDFHAFPNENDIWLIINDKYVVFNNLSDNIIEELKEKGLIFCFYKEDRTFLHGIKFE